MTAQELRIGNYVLGQTKQITKVDGFFNENKAIYTDVEDERVRFIIHYLNECEGVELTEEILLKCPDIENRDTSPKSYYLHNRIIFINDNGCYDYATRVKLPYLHTFQNFIFALTGEELNIEL